MLLADGETGQLLLAENIDRQWPTASLAKMMVGLLAMEDIEREQLSLRTPVVISPRASRARGRTINLHPGEVFSLGELLQAMLVTSANDAAVAVASVVVVAVRAGGVGMDAARRASPKHTIFRSFLPETLRPLPHVPGHVLAAIHAPT